VVRALALDVRNRRLLSPSEAINALTVGASHEDLSTPGHIGRLVDVVCESGMPSPVSARGPGFRRAVKPDILLPGGRQLFTERPAGSGTTLRVSLVPSPPGQLVAAPSISPGQLDRVIHTRGTSNATALASRAAGELLDLLDHWGTEPESREVPGRFQAVVVKALLAHGAEWGSAGDLFDGCLRTDDNGRNLRNIIAQHLGFGIADIERVKDCTERRATAIGFGAMTNESGHLYRFPLPPSLSGIPGLRRLIVTLAWFSPINVRHGKYRRANLWFDRVEKELDVDRCDGDWRGVRRGTLQHEVFEGERAAVFTDGDAIAIRVNGRAEAGDLNDAVPYGLAVSLEVGETLSVPVFDEVRTRIRPAVKVQPDSQ
jgi:hypothetical protein